jgi:hypothetical protein
VTTGRRTELRAEAARECGNCESHETAPVGRRTVMRAQPRRPVCTVTKPRPWSQSGEELKQLIMNLGPGLQSAGVEEKVFGLRGRAGGQRDRAVGEGVVAEDV